MNERFVLFFRLVLALKIFFARFAREPRVLLGKPRRTARLKIKDFQGVHTHKTSPKRARQARPVGSDLKVARHINTIIKKIQKNTTQTYIFFYGKVIIMFDEYYYSLVEGLLINCKQTVEFIDNCCPTRFLNGNICPTAINRSNIASMIIEDFNLL